VQPGARLDGLGDGADRHAVLHAPARRRRARAARPCGRPARPRRSVTRAPSTAISLPAGSGRTSTATSSSGCTRTAAGPVAGTVPARRGRGRPRAARSGEWSCPCRCSCGASLRAVPVGPSVATRVCGGRRLESVRAARQVVGERARHLARVAHVDHVARDEAREPVRVDAPRRSWRAGIEQKARVSSLKPVCCRCRPSRSPARGSASSPRSSRGTTTPARGAAPGSARPAAPARARTRSRRA
jgi:hypothetical protein